MVKSMFQAGVLKLKMQLQQAVEDVKGRVQNANDTSNEHQQTVTVM